MERAVRIRTRPPMQYSSIGLGHNPFKVERRVQLPYTVPLIKSGLRIHPLGDTLQVNSCDSLKSYGRERLPSSG